MVVYKIEFSRKNWYRGLDEVLGVGHGTFGQRDRELNVTEEAIKRLDDCGVPYKIVGRSDRPRSSS